MKSKRFCSLLAICLSVCLLLVACGETGGGSDDTRVVLELDDFEVIADTYRFFYLSYGMELAEEADWLVNVSAIDGKLRSFAETSICELYAIYSLAQEFDVSLTDLRKEQMEAAISQILEEEGGKDAYYEKCEAYYMTGDLFRMLYLESEYLKNDLYIYLTANHYFPDDKETVMADIRTNFYRCSEIYFSSESSTAKADASRVLADIQAGGHTFSEYAGSPTIYVKGERILSFEEAVLALKVGEMSGVVETEGGYHILKRLPLEDSHIEAEYEELRELYLCRLFTELLADRAGEMELTRTRKHGAVLADLQEELTERIAEAKAAEQEK